MLKRIRLARRSAENVKWRKLGCRQLKLRELLSKRTFATEDIEACGPGTQICEGCQVVATRQVNEPLAEDIREILDNFPSHTRIPLWQANASPISCRDAVQSIHPAFARGRIWGLRLHT